MILWHVMGQFCCMKYGRPLGWQSPRSRTKQTTGGRHGGEQADEKMTIKAIILASSGFDSPAHSAHSEKRSPWGLSALVGIGR